MEARDLRIRRGNCITSPVVLLLNHYLRLFGEVVKPLLDLLHQAIEVPAQLCQRRGVEEEKALRGSARSCAGRRGSASSGRGYLLVVSKQGDFIVCQTQLRVRHSL